MRPFTPLEQAHFNNRKQWMNTLGVDCYLNAFCDVSDDPSIVTTMSLTLLSYITNNMNLFDTPLYDHIIRSSSHYASNVIAQLSNKQEVKRHAIAMSHFKLCGLFWREYGYNFYHPIFMPILEEDNVNLPSVQMQAKELNARIKQWNTPRTTQNELCSHKPLSVLLSRIEKELHFMNRNDK